MKAPDKIYISHLCDTTIDGEEGHLMAMSFEDNGGEKFIRKDALLEWAKEVHDSGPIKDSADKGDAWSIGYLSGMKDIIDKLNTL